MEISDILNDGSSDSQIALLLTENLRDIYTYIFPLIHEDNSRENSSSTKLMGSNALAHLRKYLSEEIIARQAGKESHYVVRQLLKLSGKNVVYYNNTTVCQVSYVNSIKYIADQLSGGKSKLKSGCIFQDAGTSITECLLHARLWLDRSKHETEKRQSWKTIILICDEVVVQLYNRGGEKNQIGFCLNTLISIILENKHASIRPNCLSTMNAIVKAIICRNKKNNNKN